MKKRTENGQSLRGRRLSPSQLGIKVVVTDPTQMGCELMKQALVHHDHSLIVYSSTTNRSDIRASLARADADILVLSEDLEDGPYSGFEALREIHLSYPRTKVIMLLRSPTVELVVDAFRMGAKGVFSREGSPTLLCKCINAVHEGQIWANSHELQYLLEALAKSSPFYLTGPHGNQVLTKREDQVAKLVADGMTNREIAKQLRLSEHTVSNYLFRIYEKLGLSGRVELVLYVLRYSQGAA